MWFIKNEFWNEFMMRTSKYTNENEILKKVNIIKENERFCEEGKGVSFYNTTTINNKIMREIESYLNNKDYVKYEIKDIK